MKILAGDREGAKALDCSVYKVAQSRELLELARSDHPLAAEAHGELAGRSADAQREFKEALEYDASPDFELDHEAVDAYVARVVVAERRRLVLRYVVPTLRHLWIQRSRLATLPG
jgi:hypothetical protein